MGTNKNNRRFLIHRGHENVLVVKTYLEEDNLDFLNFQENKEGKVVYTDTSGYDLPISSILYEAPSGSYSLTAITKTRLAAKMMRVLGETDNFYIIKEEV